MKAYIFVFVLLFPSVLVGQNYLSNIPGNGSNARYYEDIFCESRPCLTLNGFQDSYGSVDKVLERLYTGDTGSIALLNSMIIYSQSAYKVIQSGTFDESALNNNTLILQSRALIALLQYVSAKNGRNLNELNLSESVPSANDAIANLKAALTRPLSDYMKTFNTADDHVKYTRSYMSFARALDLYLALENAFEYYNEPDTYSTTTRLLTKQQKNNLLFGVHYKAYLLFDRYIISIGQYGLGQAEAGNRPMKILTAAAYIMLTMQDISQDEGDPSLLWVDNQVNRTSIVVSEAFSRNGPKTSPARRNHWAYQSDNGKRFWAEGAYYFEYALLDLLPFWHAVRQMGLLQTMEHGLNNNIPDPFHNDWFLNPVEWLADISTPDGMTPPLDDGSKRSIRVSSLLNWDSSYGRQSIGQKYAWVHNNLESYTNSEINDEPHLYLLELVIPKTQTMQAPPNIIGPGYTDSQEQQVVVRFADQEGNMHWLLMNGERGKAIKNGEGHEQPDQLQLLYYVNDQTYIKDSGYDKGFVDKSSRWNGYYHHNGISLNHDNIQYFTIETPWWWWFVPDIETDIITHENRGGVLSPYVDIGEGHKVAEHAEVNDLDVSQINALFHIQGTVELAGGTNRSSYKRNLIFVGDPSNPYLFDFNRVLRTQGENKSMRLSYHLPRYLTYSSSMNNNNMALFSAIGTTNNKQIGFYATQIEVSTFPDNILYSESTSEPFGNSWKRIFQPFKIQELHNSVISTESITDAEGDVYTLSTRFRLYTPKSTADKSLNSISMFVVGNDLNDIERMLQTETITNYMVNNHIKVISWKPYSSSSNQHDTIIDFAFKRNTNDPSFNSSATFNTGLNDVSMLKIEAGKEFGFARLKKQNGLWKIDPDYQVNITQPGYYYASNQTVGSYTYPSGAKLFIGDNVTLTFTGTVNLNNAEVFLGKDAKISVSGGKIEANYTEFKRLNANDEYEGVYISNSDENLFTYCTFTGAFRGIHLNNSEQNTIAYSTFSENAYGLYVINYSDVVVVGGKFHENDFDGIRAYNHGSVSLLMTNPANPDPHPQFTNNGSNGVDIDGNSSLWAAHTYFLHNDGYDIEIDYNSVAYVGDGNNVVPGPWSPSIQSYSYNAFVGNGSSDKYIYNMAMSYNGENYTSWIVPAQYNYWAFPGVSTAFHGPVDKSNPLYYNDVFPNYKAVSSTMPESPKRVQTASDVINIREEISDEDRQQRATLIQQNLFEIQHWMDEKPFDPENGRWLRSYASMLQFAGKNGFNAERKEARNRLNRWLARYHVLNSLSADSLLEYEKQASAVMMEASANRRELGSNIQRNDRSLAEVSSIVGEVAVLLEIEEALRRKEFDRVELLYDKYAPAITNVDNQYGLLSALSLAYQGKREYGAALAVIKQIEQLTPEKGMTEGFIAPDFSDIKQILSDSAKALKQEIQFLKQKPGKIAQTQDLPEYFELRNAYPNPFNPSTNIPFSLPEDGKVRVEVFDVMGRLVSVLTNQSYKAGTHQLTFDANGLASGVYLIQIQFKNMIETQKITLVK